MNQLRGFSLTQPWASLVAFGEKRYETRSFATELRGPLAIHASKGFPPWCRNLCEQKAFKEALARHGIDSWRDLPVGMIVGRVDLRDCERTDVVRKRLIDSGEFNEVLFGDYTVGRHAFRLSAPACLMEPIPFKGSLGFWRMSEEIARQVVEGELTP